MTSKKQKHFLKLYQPVHARFEKFCRARAFGDMPYEDLINDSLLIAFKKMEEIKNEKAFLSFLISKNHQIPNRI
jgi:RNA polymerase sigma-70 factor (ECF subfamily)